MTAALVTTGILMSCGGGDDGPGLTAGEQLINALVDGSWTVNGSTTTVDEQTVTVTNITVNFTEGSSGTVNFSVTGGGIQNYVSGGSFSVADDASLSNYNLTVASTDLQGSVNTVSATDTRVTINITVSAVAARETGVGEYNLVFDVVS